MYTYFQELKGKFLIKGKRLNKLEACFAPETAAADDEDVTEEEESNDDNEDEHKEEDKSKVELIIKEEAHHYIKHIISIGINFLCI